MNVRFLVGRAKSSKTAEIYSQIAKNEKNGIRSLLIVPSRFTYESERALCYACDGGIINTAVCSLANIGPRILNAAGERRTFMSAIGRYMVIRRAIDMSDPKIFARSAQKTGFAKQMDLLISRFAAYDITPEDLLMLGNDVERNVILKDKLTDIAEIYSLVIEHMNKESISPPDERNAIVNCIPKAEFCNAHLFIDGLEDDGDRTIAIMEGLFKQAKSVTVAIRSDFEESIFENETALFRKLKKIAEDIGADITVERMNRKPGAYKSNMLSFMEKELYAYPHKRYAGEYDGGIELMTADDETEEIRAVAAKISDLVRNRVRYREIAVVSTDEAKYSPIIVHELGQYGIKTFSDKYYGLNNMNCTSAILAAIKCVASGYRTLDIIELIKSGFCPLKREECELLEDYIVAYGVRNGAITKPFIKGSESELNEVNPIREKLMKGLNRLQKKMAGGSVKDKTDALFVYLDECKLRKRLEEITEDLENENRFELAEVYRQVWNKIVEVLDQMSSVMGNDKMSREKYVSILEEGFSETVLSTVPATLDMVTCGSFRHTITGNIKHLFVVGANDLKFPNSESNNDLIDDNDLDDMKSTGLKLWDSDEKQTIKAELDIYSLLTSPTDGVHISFSTTDDGKQVEPAPVFSKLLSIFPQLAVINCGDIRRTDKSFAVTAIRKLADGLEITPHEESVLSAYLNSPEHQNFIKNALIAVNYNPSSDSINKELAHKLFSDGKKGSATALERFNECQFKHFMSNGMRMYKKREYKMNAKDFGIVSHEVLEKFVRYIIDHDIDIPGITDNDVNIIIDAVVKEVLEDYNTGIMTENNRNMARSEIILDMLKNTARAIIHQMQHGKFKFASSELEFESGTDIKSCPPVVLTLSDGSDYHIRGKIDRVDEWTDNDGTRYVRIVDYKRRGKDFSITRLFYGVDLQLPIYLQAVTQMGDKTMPAGFYYMPIEVEAPKKGKSDNNMDVQYKLKGISVDSGDLITSTDMDIEKIKKPYVVDSGPVKAKGGLIDDDGMDSIIKYSIERARSTAEAILNGGVSARPFDDGSKTACDYCDYKSVCMFDTSFPNCKKRRVRSVDVSRLVELKPVYDDE